MFRMPEVGVQNRDTYFPLVETLRAQVKFEPFAIPAAHSNDRLGS
jgi:hypothetical protein